MPESSKILFTIFINNWDIFYTFHFQYFTMRHEDLFYVLALLKVDGVGDVIAKKLLSHFPEPSDIFNSRGTTLGAIDGVGKGLVRKLKDKSIFEKAEAELAFIEKYQIDVSFFLDHHYPDRLKHCHDGPVLLFSSGNIQLKNKKIISIVGTRQISSYGQHFCRNLIAELSPLDPIIVSGFAYGVDIVAHQAALEYNLQTIAIVAHGLNQIYPKAHKKFVHRIEENGGLMTEFWSITNPDRENFVRRNRIVAGISEATIVIESAEKGGSMLTANFANDYNRDVFAVPGRVGDQYSQGCNLLIKTQKANLLTHAADLIYHLNWDLETKSKPIQKQLFVDLNLEEQKTYDFLTSRGKESLDIIALECDFPVFKISTILLNMELKGVVRPLPGKQYEAI
jgi:DNA processing protein